MHSVLLFRMQGGQTGKCYVTATLYDHTTRTMSTWDSGFVSWPPIYVASRGITVPWLLEEGITNNLPLNFSHIYSIDISLYRPQTAVGVCSPTANAVYMQVLP